MPQLDLSNEERDVVVETLKSALSDLRYEIANTDSYDFRQGLKQKEEILTRVVSALETS